MTAENASSEEPETFDPKPYLDRLTKRLQSAGKTVCAVTVATEHGTSPILCAECCTCTGFYDCVKETKWEEMLGQVLDLKDALTGVMVHTYHMASDPGEFRMPLEDVEGRDGKSL